MIWWLVVLLILVKKCENLPLSVMAKLDDEALDRLKQWGYLPITFNKDLNGIRSHQQLTDALKTFQRFAYIESTGVYDDATKRMMNAPRCGLPDIISVEEHKRRKRRFVAQGSKWKSKTVTWQLETDNNDIIPNSIVREFMTRSLKKWSDEADIDFVELKPPPDGPPIGSSQIRVRFEEGDHGDGFPFDGRSGTLAHAFFPLTNEGLSGDIHFDDAESYTILDEPRSSGKIKLLWVAVHELGHSLGLSHSQLFGAIMYPFYTHFPGTDFRLTMDDINGIVSIYGPKPTKSTTSISTPTTKSTDTVITPEPTTCITRTTAIILYDGQTPYIFNQREVFFSDTRGFVEIKPRGSFEKPVDTLHKKIGNPNHVAFIHGNTFSVYDNRTNRPVYLDRLLTDGYQGLPDGFSTPDAAFILPNNNKLYMFKGSKYWRFTENAVLDYVLDFDYPRQIRFHWYGVPDDIDAAFVYLNSDVYFFKGDEYYRFDTERLEVKSGYPRKNKDGFMRCSPQSNLMENLIFHSSSQKLCVNYVLFISLLLFIII